MEIKIINKSNNPNPSYATAQSAGMDLRANLEAEMAQMVVAKHEFVSWIDVANLEKSERGDGGFGSTGG